MECQNITLSNILVECQNITMSNILVECQNIAMSTASKYYFEYKYTRQNGVECIVVEGSVLEWQGRQDRPTE